MKLSLKNSKNLAKSESIDDGNMDRNRNENGNGNGNRNRAGIMLIHGSYDYNLEQILKQTVFRIQKKFDLDPDRVVRKWIEQEGFRDKFEEINRKIYSQSLNQSGFLRNNLEKLLSVNNPDEFADKYWSKEFEKCGYILDNFSNGYVKFCNCHKYLHKTKYKVDYQPNQGELRSSRGDAGALPGAQAGVGVGTGEINHNGDVKHFFVRKTGAQILEELIFRLKFNIFLIYSRKVVDAMIQNFVEWINQNYEIHFVAEEGFEKLSGFLQRYPAHFRSKIAFRNKEGDLFCRIYLDRVGANNGVKEAKILTRLGFKLLDGIGIDQKE